MADDTITITSPHGLCGQCGYDTAESKTWKNYCPMCKKSGTLVLHASSGGPDQEVSCRGSGGCQADFCGKCGNELNGTLRSKLTAATATSTDTSSTGSKSLMSFWEMIKDLQKPLDGEVEVKVIGDRIYIHKIPDQNQTELFLAEGINVIDDSITIHDYNPDTINLLIVKWGKNYDKYIILKNQKLIDRFGVHAKEVKACIKKTEYVTETVSDSTTSDSSSTTSTSSASGTSTNNKTTSKGTTKKKSTKKKSTKKKSTQIKTAYTGTSAFSGTGGTMHK